VQKPVGPEGGGAERVQGRGGESELESQRVGREPVAETNRTARDHRETEGRK
jgi:hypothetical protein